MRINIEITDISQETAMTILQKYFMQNGLNGHCEYGRISVDSRVKSMLDGEVAFITVYCLDEITMGY